MSCHIDLETRSGADLKKVGAHRYAEDPSTEIICASCHDDGPGPILAHNAQFERAILNAYGANIRPEDQVCTLARAAALALPTSLEMAGVALDAPFKKNKAGHALMMKMCKPRKGGGWHETSEELARLSAYCDQDVAAERALDKLLPPLSESEQRLWVLDQTINDRGVAIDVEGVTRAQAAMLEARKRADRTMWELTDGAVSACAQTARIVTWLRGRGIPCESVAKGETDELVVKSDLFDDPTAADVVRLRSAATKTFKFPSLLACVCKDGRIRGTLQYHGALNGRWTGRLVQPQNMKRVETEEDEQTVKDVLGILAQPMSAEGHVTALDVMTGAPLEALSICARVMFVAPKGKKFVGGDFSNIEGRMNAWLAGETWKVDAFAEGQDLYRVMASTILGRDQIAKADRQLYGKVPELALGYQGGVNAFHKMGANYGVSVDDKQARRIVAGWREANPFIVASWAELQNAAIDATSAKGTIVKALDGRVSYRHDNGFLWCRLPSGRVIAYPGAIVERKHKVVVIDGEEIEFNNWGVSFWGVKKGWRKLDLYGGMQCAHVVSGAARDILKGAMFRLEACGYPIVLTVHDEVLCEVDEGFGSAAELQAIMEAREPRFDGLPVAAKAWEDVRYVK